MKCLLVIATSLVGLGQVPDLGGSFPFPLESEAIRYQEASKKGPVARLQALLDKGEVALDYDARHGYLPAVLKALGVSKDSQMLVFSKTSFQFGRISPSMPRAIYFTDDAYVGWMQGGEVVEISSVDPERGAIFHTLDQTKKGRPRFERRDECLQCHDSPRTLGVPGHLVRSVFTDMEGFPQTQAGGFVTDHRSPMGERWGGWYVTGTHGEARHMGNVVIADKTKPDVLDVEAGANITELNKLVAVSPYLTKHSDLVALMVLEHQTRMHNLITRVAYETKIALYSQEGMSKALGRPLGEWSDSTKRRIEGPAEVLLRYMLFLEEPGLKGPVEGTSGYTKNFALSGPKDSHGRSLRDLDLKTRLFQYPCSYLIYSEAFDALPAPALTYIWRRLWEVVSGQERGAAFATLTGADRKAIREILLETKQKLPEYWKP